MTNTGKTLYSGIADAYGVESFVANASDQDRYGLSIRAAANRHRRAVFYDVQLNEEQVSAIKKELDKRDRAEALRVLKRVTKEDGVKLFHLGDSNNAVWVEESFKLIPNPELDDWKSTMPTTTDEMVELEDQLQRVPGNERLEVHVGVNPDSLPQNQGDMQISAYLTDEGLVVDVFHGDSEEAIASGWETFSDAGLEAPQPVQKDDQ